MKNPLTKLTGLFGLGVTGALAYLVVTNSLSLEDAAIRAGVTLLAVMLTRRLVRVGMALLADSLERQIPPSRPPHGRRRTDVQSEI